jgi:uncharacterized membrane protein YjgN (DUF898 family)
LNGNRFDYHGEPKAILKGNLLVAAIALAYVGSGTFAPTLSAFIVLSVMCLMPFFLVASLRFHLANCSFRGLRFAFNGSVKTAYGKLVVAILISLSCCLMVGILYAVANGFFDFEFNAAFSSVLLISLAILPIVSLSLIAAMFISGLRLFVMNNIKFGNADLNCNVGFAQFSKVTLKSVSLAGAAMLLLAIVAWVVNVSVFTGLVDFALPTASEPATLQDEAAQEQAQVAMQAKAILSSMGIIAVLGYLVLFIMGAYLKTAVDNLVWNNTMLANQHQFRSTASPMAATWIHMSNIVLIALTIGLFLPFARIRSARYRIAHMTFQPVGSIDEIVRIEQAKQTVFGDSMSDALGLELGI